MFLIIGTSLLYPTLSEADGEATICPPLDLTVTQTDSATVLNWTAPNCGTQQPERYAISFQVSSDGGWGIATGNGGDAESLKTTMIIDNSLLEGLKPAGSEWIFSIRSDNDTLHLYSTWSNQVTAVVGKNSVVAILDPTPTPSLSPSVEPIPTPSPTSVPTPSPTPTVEPTPSPSPTPTQIPTPEPSPTNTPLPPAPSPTPSPVDTSTPVPVQPTPLPVPTPSPTPSPQPIPEPTPVPIPVPVPAPIPVQPPVVEPQPVPIPVPVPVLEPPAPPAPEPIPVPVPVAEPIPVPVEPPPVVEEPAPVPVEEPPAVIPDPIPEPPTEPPVEPVPPPTEETAPPVPPTDEPVVVPPPVEVPPVDVPVEPIPIEKPVPPSLPPVVAGLTPNSPDQLPETTPKQAPVEVLVAHVQVDIAGVENGGIAFFGTKSQPQVVQEDGTLTPASPPPGSGLPIPVDAITIVDTFIGQPGGVTFNAPDVAVPTVLVPVEVPAALDAIPGAGAAIQAVNQAYVALANIGNDMSPITRKKAKKILVITTVISQATAFRRKP